MNIKKVLGVVGLLATGYGVGKLAGEIKMIKLGLDLAEDVMPGIKRTVAESVSDAIISTIFDRDPDKEKEES